MLVSRLQIFIQLSPTVTKLCGYAILSATTQRDVSADGGHFEHVNWVVTLNVA